MTNPLYNVNISYFRGGDIDHYVLGTPSTWPASGVTYSVPVYTPSYFVAYMATLNISATASDYRAALNNLLIIATSSVVEDPGIQPYKRTW